MSDVILSNARRAMADRLQARVVTESSIAYCDVEGVDGTTILLRDRGGRPYSVRAAHVQRLDVLDGEPARGPRPGVPSGRKRVAP